MSSAVRSVACPECGGKIVDGENAVYSTLLAYQSPPGHNHDDNCRKRAFACENGHRFALSKRARCDATNPDGTKCTWIGQERCFCHPGNKVDDWPVVQWP